jgi:hypothetical protein
VSDQDAELVELMAVALRSGLVASLRQDEVETLAKAERCGACEHLTVLHEDFAGCRVDGCPCYDGELPGTVTARLCETCGLVVRRPVDQERCDACLSGDETQRQ